MNLKSNEGLSPREFHKCIGRFLYETGTEFDAIQSDSFQLMLGLKCGQTAYSIPSYDDLRGWILRDLLKEMQLYVNNIKSSWESTGCSILLDGWEDSKGQNLVNVLVTCPKGTVYIRSADIANFHPDSDTVEVFFEEVLADVGVKNVIQILSHSASPTMEAVGKQLMDKYKTFFWTVNGPYCIELVLEKLGMSGFIREIFKKAKTITRFVHGHASVLRLLRDQTSVHDLVKPSKIRSTMPYLTLENMVFEKVNLEKLFLSSAWKSLKLASTAEGKMVTELVADRSFWAGAILVLKATCPLVKVLDVMNNSDDSQLGHIYETMDQAKETIRQELKDLRSLYMPFWEAIDNIWNQYLHSPLHAAGYFLNPNLFYRNDFYVDIEVSSGLLCCIVCLGGDQRTRDEIMKQVDMYQNASGAFGLGSANLHSYVSPGLYEIIVQFYALPLPKDANKFCNLVLVSVTWWLEYGKEYPELQKLAIQILSQTCSGASKYKLKRSVAENLLSMRRNQIEQQRLTDLAFVHYNLQLQNFESCFTDDISIYEMNRIEDWIGDNAQPLMSPSDEPTWMDLDCRDSTNAGISKNFALQFWNCNLNYGC